MFRLQFLTPTTSVKHYSKFFVHLAFFTLDAPSVIQRICLTTLFTSRQYKTIADINRTITKRYPCKDIQALASKFCIKTWIM